LLKLKGDDMSATNAPSPKPIDVVHDEGNPEAFILYPPIGKDLEHVPIHVRPDVFYYRARMGFLPNAIKLYLHVPWIGEHLFRLNNAIMRDERNSLDEQLKYRLALVASRANECTYCVSHHACTLQRRWGYGDEQLAETLDPEAPHDEREALAMEFVRQASKDPAGVTDDLRGRLAQNFTPQEVMEIVLLIGFWKMYNLMHIAMAVPLEDLVAGYRDWVHFDPMPRPQQDNSAGS
jgi:AhpD family alkylhydroperoxidase